MEHGPVFVFEKSCSLGRFLFFPLPEGAGQLISVVLDAEAETMFNHCCLNV